MHKLINNASSETGGERMFLHLELLGSSMQTSCKWDKETGVLLLKGKGDDRH